MCGESSFSKLFLWKMFCSLKSMLGLVDGLDVEIMFIEDHARLHPWRRLGVDKVIRFRQDCYICRGRYIDTEHVELFKTRRVLKRYTTVHARLLGVVLCSEVVFRCLEADLAVLSCWLVALPR